MFLLTGVGRYLFVPLAEAVVFAMLASYILSRTLVATMAKYLLHKHTNSSDRSNSSNSFVRFHQKFEEKFEKLRLRYRGLLESAIGNTNMFIIAFLSVIFISILLLLPFLGSNFFPDVDAGQIKLHLSAPTGTRVEETAKLASEVGKQIRQVIPQDEVDTIVDNIGLPVSGINLSYSNSATSGPQDADILFR